MEQLDINIYEPQTVKERVIANMKGLGVYKAEYDDIIIIYCDLLADYQRARERFAESGYQYETETAAGGTKKSAHFAALENLWKNILMYSDRLCLNPKSLKTDEPPPTKKEENVSPLDAYLQNQA